MKIFFIFGGGRPGLAIPWGAAITVVLICCCLGSRANSASNFGNLTLKIEDHIEYQLAPFDLVQVAVYGQEDLTIRQRISDEGQLFLPLLGRVTVGGETVAYVSKLIEELLVHRGYLRAPVVSINIEEFSPKVVTVLGEVEAPGPVEIPPGRNGIPILVAVAGAGGFTGMAKLSEVRVKAGGVDASQRKHRTVNINDALKTDDSTLVSRYWVTADNIVFVPKRVF
jgi:protein involved in polysaccharide export with SLBB domain